jgi:hypothetical protein
MTGGARGICGAGGFARPLAAGGYRMGGGRGFGRGRGRGRGFGYGRGVFHPDSRFPRETAPVDEIAGLKHRAEYLKKDLDATDKRIAELETAPSD